MVFPEQQQYTLSFLYNIQSPLPSSFNSLAFIGVIIIIIESEVCRKVLPRFIRVIGLNRHNGAGEKAGMKDKKERGRRSRRKVLVDQTSL